MIRNLLRSSAIALALAVLPLSAAELAHRSILEGPQNALIDAKGQKVDAKRVALKKYLFVYFSAHWCPPCRKFTPELVKFYNENAKDGDFELLFVSADEDAAGQATYMQETGMPWPAIKLGDASIEALNKRFEVNGIPCLVLLDEKDNVVASSFKNGQYQGPGVAVDAWKKLHGK